MGRSQREKGKRGERAACAVLEELTGHPWRRSAMQARGGEDPDVLSDAHPGLHVEVKTGRAPPIRPAMEQAVGDAARNGRSVPVVLSKRDRGPWLLTVQVDHMAALMDALRGGEE